MILSPFWYYSLKESTHLLYKSSREDKMANAQSKSILHNLLDSAGITCNGDKPCDIQIHNEDFYERVLKDTTMGLGESYMDQWWDCEALDQFIHKILRAHLREKVKNNWKQNFHILKSRLFNLQTIHRAFEVGKKHYDIGNDLYHAMLDERMVYTCGYWKNADNLNDAQEAKLDLVCRKMNLEPGMTILDLGCGFGSFAKFAAENYGARVTGVTVSRKQWELGSELCQGLPVDIRLEDYRKVTGNYDRVMSIGILEHVGHKNYQTYFKKSDECLKKDGIAFVHTIGSNVSSVTCNRWINTYIFPNSMLPSIAQIAHAMEGLFVMEDWHNFGEDYDKTLMAWYRNFEAAWPDLRKSYDDRFYRMFRFYLLGCAGTFRARDIQLWQIVMTKPGMLQPECRFA